MEEIRCPRCEKLLFKVQAKIIFGLRIEIMCKKCKVTVFWPKFDLEPSIMEADSPSVIELDTSSTPAHLSLY